MGLGQTPADTAVGGRASFPHIAVTLSRDKRAQQRMSHFQQLFHQTAFHLIDTLSALHGQANVVDQVLKLGFGLEKRLLLRDDHGKPPFVDETIFS